LVQVRGVSIGGYVRGDETDVTANTTKALGALRGFAAKLEKVGGAAL
jgi:hypothetical protein